MARLTDRTYGQDLRTGASDRLRGHGQTRSNTIKHDQTTGANDKLWVKANDPNNCGAPDYRGISGRRGLVGQGALRAARAVLIKTIKEKGYEI